MERTPRKAPLPCFGLEHSSHDPECHACPHYHECSTYMGSRRDKVPLDKIRFDIVPAEKWREHTYDMEDPELPYLQRLYCDCFVTVFRRNPLDNVGRFKNEIAANAMKAKCSVRMFMLANMVAHEVAEKEIVAHTEKQRSAAFRVKLLTAPFSIKRAEAYEQLCSERYGTFGIKSLSVLTGEDKDPLEQGMAHSEQTAAQWIVRHKVHTGTPRDDALRALYESEEIQLQPEWLALEETYEALILKPFLEKAYGSQLEQRHRFSVVQVYKHYKKNPSIGRNAWLTRQSIMREVLLNVISSFGYQPSDFLYPREPVRKPMDFWLELAYTIRQNHCWRHIQGEPSFFTPKRHEAQLRRS